MLPNNINEGAVFNTVLHSRKCSEGAGTVYQDPAHCESDGGFTPGCNAAKVAASPTPLEMTVGASLDSHTLSNGKQLHRLIGEFTWNAHVPAFLEGQTIDQLSMVLYDPRTGNMMTCADLEPDRQLDGVVYYVNQVRVRTDVLNIRIL